jgi:hypothetical protein
MTLCQWVIEPRMFRGNVVPTNSKTYRPLKMRALHSLEMSRPDYPLTQRPIYLPRIIFSKRKVPPITGHEGPEGEYRCSSTLSLTSALGGGGGGRGLTPCPGRFTHKNDRVPIVQEVEWAPGPVRVLLRANYKPTRSRKLSLQVPVTASLIVQMCSKSRRGTGTPFSRFS